MSVNFNNEKKNMPHTQKKTQKNCAEMQSSTRDHLRSIADVCYLVTYI